jgi:hypothetical protein
MGLVLTVERELPLAPGVGKRELKTDSEQVFVHCRFNETADATRSRDGDDGSELGGNR